jgi:hypothetical protein
MLIDGIDIRRLRRDVAAASLECLALKRTLRRRWTEPMGDVQRSLAHLARQVTERCTLLAFLRGRWHVTAPPRSVRDAGAAWDRDEHNTRVAERVARDYRLPEPAAVAGAAP